MHLAFAPLLLLTGALTVHAAGEPAIIKGADQFEFIYRVKLPEITGTAHVWIPLAKTDSFQTVTVEALNIQSRWRRSLRRGRTKAPMTEPPPTAAKRNP